VLRRNPTGPADILKKQEKPIMKGLSQGQDLSTLDTKVHIISGQAVGKWSTLVCAEPTAKVGVRHINITGNIRAVAYLYP
jgi:hypothetical protein